jgi:uncharacterized protein (TIGR02246 family)
MRSWKTICVLGALAVLGSGWVQRAETKEAAAEEIAGLLEKHKTDYLTGDADAWAALYAEDATFIGGQRNLQTRQAIRDSFARLFKDFPTRTVNVSDLRIRVYNEATTSATAIINADNKGTRSGGSGGLVNTNNRESVVWAKIQGKWLIVNHQTSPIQ